MGEPGTGVLEVQKLAIDGIWGFSEISNVDHGDDHGCGDGRDDHDYGFQLFQG